MVARIENAEKSKRNLAIIRYHDVSVEYVRGLSKRQIIGYLLEVPTVFLLLRPDALEAATSDTTHGGGHVAAVIVSAKAKQGYKSATLYQHQSVLRLIPEGLRVSNPPGLPAPPPRWGNSSESVIHRDYLRNPVTSDHLCEPLSL